ncbi:hypothetical protein DWZ29_06050 [Anaerobutyricum hallii]|uniref:Uncharacterized protein n=1 Tax=Anaerobutyricum hallii TaxID=39488 RepID=A0A415U969_9FIRM|nr:hypothetical protein DWZ29_06050 [Anaerobutyricum hallii]
MLWGSDGYVSPYRFHYETTQSPGESPNLPPFCFNSTKSSHCQPQKRQIPYICDLGARFECERVSEHSNRRD